MHIWRKCLTLFCVASSCSVIWAQTTTPAATAHTTVAPTPAEHAAEWLTTQDRAALVAKQPEALVFLTPSASSSSSPSLPTITVNDAQTLQTMDGFGFALTGGSAQLLMKMSAAKRHALLQELFGDTAVASGDTGNAGAIGVSYLRVSIGSSDMNERVFTYDDQPQGSTDPTLHDFQMGPDLRDVIPVLQEILSIQPKLKILGTPWSAPSWMKTNGLPKSGSLKPEFYAAYAQYLVRYVEAMGQHGIAIDAITPQNEPLNQKNTPSMGMTAEEEDTFIREALGPAFHAKHLATKIILYDHNCDRPDYPLTILADKAAAQYVDGSGFHLYGGTVDAMTQVHDAFPKKNLYFTEQMVVDDPKATSELRVAKPVAEVVIGAISNWSRNVLLWNLAADPEFGPHTGDGGCPVCQGAVTLAGDAVTRNSAYYTMAHVSKFVQPGSVRVASTVASGAGTAGAPAQVAFRRPDGKVVLLVSNISGVLETFAIGFHGKVARASLAPGAVATYVW